MGHWVSHSLGNHHHHHESDVSKSKPSKPSSSSEKKVKCTSCQNGYYEAWVTEPCPDCAGTGRDTDSELWALPCHGQCGGRRTITYNKRVRCNVCGGSGWIIDYWSSR